MRVNAAKTTNSVSNSDIQYTFLKEIVGLIELVRSVSDQLWNADMLSNYDVWLISNYVQRFLDKDKFASCQAGMCSLIILWKFR